MVRNPAPGRRKIGDEPLASMGELWQGAAMTDERGGKGFGGGIYIAVALLAGAGVGIYLGQPSAGILAGLVLGGAAATLDWMIRRKD